MSVCLEMEPVAWISREMPWIVGSLVFQAYQPLGSQDIGTNCRARKSCILHCSTQPSLVTLSTKIALRVSPAHRGVQHQGQI